MWLQVADALQVEPHLVYQYAVQGRLMCLTDVQDIMVDIPSDIACKVLHYIVNMCIELFAGHSFCDWSLKSHWAEITISLLRNYDDLFGKFIMCGQLPDSPIEMFMVYELVITNI